MNNAVYGKTCENLRKRIDVKLVTGRKKRIKYIDKANCKGFKIFHNGLAAISMMKHKLLINKPSYVGFCVLELSKLLMMEFHYNFIKKNYQERAKLILSDTDSFMYEIQTEDVYQDFFKAKEYFDFSSYPVTSPFFDKTNAKVVGKFKDETSGVPIKEVICLKAKMYTFITDDGKVVKKAKGIQKKVVKSFMSHDD